MGRSHDQEFSKFAVEHRDALLRTAFLLTGDRGLAEDLVQTALVKAYLAWGRIRSRDAAGACTRRIMVATALSGAGVGGGARSDRAPSGRSRPRGSTRRTALRWAIWSPTAPGSGTPSSLCRPASGRSSSCASTPT